MERKQGIVGNKKGYISQQEIQLAILWSSVKQPHWQKKQWMNKGRQREESLKEGNQISNVCEPDNFFFSS